ncbi:Tetracyclin repressor-like, C-terminal domain superfamily, partial [Klenkia terrae]|jgi:AcrR family transcriptional regulator
VTRDAPPTAVEAFRVARRRFVAGHRVELSDVAAELGVNRVTVHRWLGNRTAVLTEVVWSLTAPTLAGCYDRAPGLGGARVADAMADFVRLTVEHPGMRAFLEREHETALRVLTRRDHDFQRRIIGAVEDLLEREQRAGHLDAGYPLPDLAFLVVRVVEGFVYVERIVGEQPEPDRAARALHFLLR